MLPNKFNIIGGIVGIFSGCVVAYVFGEIVESSYFIQFYGLVFGVISASYLFTSIIKTRKIFLKTLFWILSCGISWFASFWSFIALAEVADGSKIPIFVAAFVGANILFISLSIINKQWDSIWYLRFILVSFCATLFSYWLAENNDKYFDILEGDLNFIHILWEGTMLYLVVSYIQDLQSRKFFAVQDQ